MSVTSALREPRGRTGTNSSQSQGEPASHQSRIGQTVLPSLTLSFQQGPSELQGARFLRCAGKVTPRGGLSSVQDSPPACP